MTRALFAELDAWAAAGRVATLWWRDDDAVSATPALDHLLEASADQPLALAVVPQDCDAGLARRLAGTPQPVDVLQHGFAHADHSPLGAKKAEFTVGRLGAVMAAEVREGFARLIEIFGSRFLPVFVPPWNRYPLDLLPWLVESGHRVLSAYGARKAPEALPGLLQVNAHVDANDWSGDRRFVGAHRLAEGLAAHLAARRSGAADPAEPTGLLTHHLQLDRADLAVIGSLVQDVALHPAARWVPARAFTPVDGAPPTR